MRFLAILLMVFCARSAAESSSLNLALPNTGGSYSSDRIRAGDIECQNAIGATTNLEFGVVGIINQNGPFNTYGTPGYEGYDENGLVRDVGVYAKITIPLAGAPKERINCNVLFKLEMEKKRLEIQRLQQEVANLRALKFEGDK